MSGFLEGYALGRNSRGGSGDKLRLRALAPLELLEMADGGYMISTVAQSTPPGLDIGCSLNNFGRSNQTIVAGGAAVAIAWTNPSGSSGSPPGYDSSGFYNSGTPTILTVPAGLAGKYLIWCDINVQFTIAGASAAGQYWQCNLTIGPGYSIFPIELQPVTFASPTGGYTFNGHSSMSYEANLVVGDTVIVSAFGSTAANGVVLGNASCQVGMRKIDKAG